MLQAAYTAPQGATPPDATKARATAILCALLALATATVTSWFVVEGIKATEPASTARWAKVAAGVLLLVLELGAFGVAAQWLQHGRVLRALGWFVLALEITLMSLAQISIGTSAGKAAAAASGTVESRTQQADDYRKAAALLEEQAATLKASKHAWKRAQGEQKAAEAAALNARAAAAVEARASEATGDTATSTPLVEIVGKWGLIGLSVALSLALSLGGIVMMHVAGSLWRRASGDVVPVEVQILRALHELQQRLDSGVRPVVPRKVVEVEGDDAPALPAPQPEPEKSTGDGGKLLSWRVPGWAPAVPAFLAAAAPGKAPAAPVVPQAAKPAAGIPERGHPTIPEQGHPQGHHEAPESARHEPEQAPIPGASAIPEQGRPAIPERGQQEPEKKPRRARALDGGRPDTGTDPTEDGSRFNRVRKAIKAGKLRPSLNAVMQSENCGEAVARRYLTAMEADLLERRGRVWVLKNAA